MSTNLRQPQTWLAACLIAAMGSTAAFAAGENGLQLPVNLPILNHVAPGLAGGAPTFFPGGNIPNVLPPAGQISATPSVPVAPIVQSALSASQLSNMPLSPVPSYVNNSAVSSLMQANPTTDTPHGAAQGLSAHLLHAAESPVYVATLSDVVPGLQVVTAGGAPFNLNHLDNPAIIASNNAAYKMGRNGVVALKSGDLLVSTSRRKGGTVVELPSGTRAFIAKGAEALVSVAGNQERVSNLSGGNRSVFIDPPGQAPVVLNMGYELTRLNGTFNAGALRANDSVMRRPAVVLPEANMAVSELSLPSVLKQNGLVASTLSGTTSAASNTSTASRALVNNLRKAAAVQMVLRGVDGFVAPVANQLATVSTDVTHAVSNVLPNALPPLLTPIVPAVQITPNPTTSNGGSPSIQQAITAVPVSYVQTIGAAPVQSGTAGQTQSFTAPTNVVASGLQADQTRPLLSQLPGSTNGNNLRNGATSRFEPSTTRRAPAPSLVAPVQPFAPGTLRAAREPMAQALMRGASGAVRPGIHLPAPNGAGTAGLEGLLPGGISALPHAVTQSIQRHPNIAALAIALILLLLALTAYFAYSAHQRANQLAIANAALAKARDEAIEASRLKSEFVANLSHEIRTPVTAVLGTISLLFETKLDSKQRDIAAILRESAQSLLEVINGILDFSKIEAGKVSLESVDFYPAALVREATDVMAAAAREKGLILGVDAPADLPRVKGDPYRLRQVLLNLIGNSIKFTSAGSVSVLVRALDASDDRVLLRFSVKDTGIGIQDAARTKLFQPFVQADGSTTREFGGTGLGLSISRRLVDLMGGTIDYESSPGQGAEFWFDVPLTVSAELPPSVVPAEAAMQMSEEASSAAPACRTVLVAEDNKVLQRIVKTQLENLGYGVELANNGREALEAASSGQYSLILMDWQMPEMDGLDATRQIRRSGSESATTPIIAMTANAMEGDRTKCMEAGMNDYISKPFSMQQLKDVLERWAS